MDTVQNERNKKKNGQTGEKIHSTVLDYFSLSVPHLTIELDEDVLGVIEDDALEVGSDEDDDGSVVVLGLGLRLEGGLEGAGKEAAEVLLQRIGGNGRGLGEHEVLVGLAVLNDDAGKRARQTELKRKKKIKNKEAV